MADNDTQFLAGVTRDNATLLLAAAEELGLDSDVVTVDHDRGGFTAPAAVVKRASEGGESEEAPPPDEPPQQAAESAKGELPPKARRSKKE
jgi:hypothetical protein